MNLVEIQRSGYVEKPFWVHFILDKVSLAGLELTVTQTASQVSAGISGALPRPQTRNQVGIHLEGWGEASALSFFEGRGDWIAPACAAHQRAVTERRDLKPIFAYGFSFHCCMSVKCWKILCLLWAVIGETRDWTVALTWYLMGYFLGSSKVPLPLLRLVSGNVRNSTW